MPGTPGEALSALRSFRDTQLAHSPSGAGIIIMYYMYSSEVSDILARQPALADKVRSLILEMLPSLQESLASGNKLVLTTAQYAAVQSVLGEIRQFASYRLQTAIDKTIAIIESGRLADISDSGM